ncbi:hypothetical protein BGZ80_006564 [Entomortierella chlamydospora]|uniref:Uncharacterized protein n=1 Tax=Entomortierella chlamydospora TaxID=101097 RepID=A0A9P6MYS2_9FUNG|nr:hypothetical protein BGZ80_006564 [Entomortierella chlamydospora]
MTAIMNYFDTRPSKFDIEEDITNDILWLRTYSRALCSLYRKDEDIILNLHPTTTFEKFTEASSSFAAPSLQSNRSSAGQSRQKSHQRRTYQHHPYSRSSRTDILISSKMEDTTNNVVGTPSIPREATPFKDTTEESTEDVVKRLRSTPSSPGSKLSQILCNIGFKWIDYFSPLDDEQAEETDAAIQEDTGSYWAADVYGKRAALERRRTLSRTSSVANGASDSWIEVLERVGHWEETA